MPKDDFFDLGRDPKKMNDVGREDKVSYPCIHDIDPKNFPPMADMRLGDTAEVLARVKISLHGGLEIQELKWIGKSDPKAKSDKDKLLARHKKNQMKQAGEPTLDADSGGGYGEGGF